MAAPNMYGASVLNGPPFWLNASAYNQHKMNRPYGNDIDHVSGSMNGMSMYSTSAGQAFDRVQPGFPGRFPPGLLTGPFSSHNTWNGGHFLMPHTSSQHGLAQGNHFSSMPSNGPPIGSNVVQQSVEVPDLARRNSLSSNEEYGPRTPFFASQTLGGANKLIVPDNSPQNWNSPSTLHLNQPIAGNPQQLWREVNGYVVVDYDAICTTAPIIPRPIPAIFSGDKSRGTLETSLENKNKTTNVYIRGLHPDTTDEMLHAYGSRFGTIDSAKSMIDQHTGLCKGFGFIKYQSSKDGENCIRGFYHWGYEAKWARDSHNDKLKKLGDDNNTNLYISNIPMDLDFNEHALMAIFAKHDCLSAKILRDTNGLSRGVGFARFSTPDVCRAIIQEYNGQPVGAEGQPISIRFADTPRQKDLKAVTQERRQYKTHEYNVAAFGPDSPYRHMGAIVAAAAAATNSPIQNNRSPLVNQPWIIPQPPYGMGLPANATGAIPVTGSGATDGQVENTPLSGRTGLRLTPHSVALNAAKAEEIKTEVVSESDQNTEAAAPLTKRNPNVPVKAVGEQSAKPKPKRENASAHGSTHSSPIKATPIKSFKPGTRQNVAGTE